MIRRLTMLSTLLVLLSITALPSKAQTEDPAPSPGSSDLHHRELWMLGISLGAGPGHLSNRVNDSTLEEWGGVLQLRGGGMVSPKLLFHLDLEGWFRDQLVGNATYKVDMIQYSLALTYFPFDPAKRSGGWWLRFGVGLANVKVAPDEDFASASYSEGGWNYLLAVGHEFRVSRTLALGLGLSYNGLGVSGDVFEDGRWLALTADLNWYPQ